MIHSVREMKNSRTRFPINGDLSEGAVSPDEKKKKSQTNEMPSCSGKEERGGNIGWKKY